MYLKAYQSGLDTPDLVEVWAFNSSPSPFALDDLNVCLDALEQG